MSKLKVSAIHDPDNDNEAITVDTSGNVSVSSNLKVDTIQDTTGNDALTIDSSGNVTASQGFVPPTQLSHRNLIINGDMQVAQGGTSATSLSEASDGFNKRTVDRFQTILGGSLHTAVYTVSQDSNAPAGFSNSYKVSCTTADASLDASVNSYIDYRIEAQDLQHLDYGTSNAKTLTLSFWVKSNQTGDYVSWQYTQDNSRHRGTVYTINTADTWEKKTITFSGDTSGSINNDNGIGMMVRFVFAAGTNFTSGTLPSSWESLTSANRHVGQTVNIGSSTSDYFQITGVQLEVGSVATPFEHRSYGEELARCQRYFYDPDGAYADDSAANEWVQFNLGQSGTNSNEYIVPVSFPVTMRAAPTVTVGSNDHGSGTFTTLNANGNGRLDATTSGTRNIGKDGCSLKCRDSSDTGHTGFRGWFYADAEL